MSRSRCGSPALLRLKRSPGSSGSRRLRRRKRSIGARDVHRFSTGSAGPEPSLSSEATASAVYSAIRLRDCAALSTALTPWRLRSRKDRMGLYQYMTRFVMCFIRTSVNESPAHIILARIPSTTTGKTPLHEVASSGTSAMVDTLISFCGCEKEETGKKSWRATARTTPREASLRRLRNFDDNLVAKVGGRNGDDYLNDDIPPISIIDEVDQSGRTPLHIAVMQSDGVMVAQLLRLGANVCIADSQNKFPPEYATDQAILRRLLRVARRHPDFSVYFSHLDL